MLLKRITNFVVLVLLLTAAGPGSTEPAWTQALRNIEAVTGVRFVPNTDLPARFTKVEADSNLLTLRAYREANELRQATAKLFVWKHNPGVVDWYATVPDFEEDVWKTYHADGTIEYEPLSAEFKEAYRKLLELAGQGVSESFYCLRKFKFSQPVNPSARNTLSCSGVAYPCR